MQKSAVSAATPAFRARDPTSTLPYTRYLSDTPPTRRQERLKILRTEEREITKRRETTSIQINPTNPQTTHTTHQPHPITAVLPIQYAIPYYNIPLTNPIPQHPQPSPPHLTTIYPTQLHTIPYHTDPPHPTPTTKQRTTPPHPTH